MSLLGGIQIPTLSTDPTDSPPSGYIFLYTVGSSLKFKESNGTINILSTGVTPEEVEDIVGALIQGGTGIDVNYDDGANTLTISIDASTLNTINSALQSGDNVSELVNDAGYLTTAPVTTVNGQTGDVVVGFSKFIQWFTNTVSFTNNEPVFITVYSWNTPNLQIGTYLFEVLLAVEPSATNSNDLFKLSEGLVDLATQVDYEDEGKDTGADIKRTVKIAGELIVSASGSKELNLRGAQDGAGTTVVKGALFKLEQYS